MILDPGTHIGPYQILEMIGEGGMGAVYRGLDTRLEREVAIKVLPEALAQDAQSVGRFKREARLLAALNHHGVGSIYDLEDWQGVPCLILELVPGETLERRLERGPLDLRQTLHLFEQAAEALDAAHQQQILHRDLKPGNIMLTPDGQLKLLDFGLAKALNRDFAAEAGVKTRDGEVVGTAAYLAPEQLSAEAIDSRVDVWALCCCLYQALTGRQAFSGESLGETLTAVLHREPDWEALPDHEELRELIKDGLRKDPLERIGSAAELQQRLKELEASLPRDPQAVTQELPRRRRSLRVAVAGWMWPVGLLVALGLPALGYWAGGLRARPEAPRPPRYFSISLPQDAVLAAEHSQPSLSPDGQVVVFPALSGNHRLLYRRPLNQPEATAIPETEGGAFPFFSADGQRLGYFAGDGLWWVPVGGGAPARLLGNLRASQFLGACWLADDSLVFATTSGGLQRVVAQGKPETLVAPNPQHQDAVLAWPVAGAGGVIFSVRSGGTYSSGRVELLDLKSRQRKVLQDQAFGGRPGPSGGLLYVRGRSLMLDQRVLVKEVWAEETRGETCFAAAPGTLVYLRPGESNASIPVWVDREGQEVKGDSLPSISADPRLSSDGKWLAYRQFSDNGRQVWVEDRETGARHRLTNKGNTAGVAFHPQSQQLAFGFDRNGPFNLYSINIRSGGEPTRLTTSSHRQFPKCWSAGTLLYEEETSEGTTDLWALPDGGSPYALVEDEFDEREPALSSDGHWLAYQSDESGTLEVYLKIFPRGQRVRLGPGTEPVWTVPGRLLYRQGDRLMEVADPTHPEPVEVFTCPFFGGGRRNWEPTPDGSRFLILERSSGTVGNDIQVALDLPGL